MVYTRAKKLCLRAGLSGRVLILMTKGALPPTIAIAMYRSPAVAKHYGNFGFLIALSSILSLHLQPRARFVQNLGLAVLSTCLATTVAMLSHFAGLHARRRTEAIGQAMGGYNASASVVNAIFLCSSLWFSSALRAAWPQCTIPSIICTIYLIVAITSGPETRSEHSSLVFCTQLLLSYLTGFGISTAVSLIFLPKTSRSTFVEKSYGFVIQSRNVLLKERNLLELMEHSEHTIEDREEHLATQAIALKASTMAMIGSMSDLREELSYARQEVSLGVYTYDDLEGLLHRLESLMVPLLGLSKISKFQILSSIASEPPHDRLTLVSTTINSVDDTLKALDSGVHHTALLLQVDKLWPLRNTASTDWAQYEHTPAENPRVAMELKRDRLLLKSPNREDNGLLRKTPGTLNHQGLAEVEELVYILCLLRSASIAVSELSNHVKLQLEKSSQCRWCLVIPRAIDLVAFTSIAPWNQTPAFPSKDPEHLPPQSVWERSGNMLRTLLSLLGSNASQFGLRVVLATMSIGILGFLESTQRFFGEYRLVWAMVMVPISMSPTAGAAIYGFIGRALSVTGAMIFAYINWYIVDGKAGGVVAVFCFFMMVYYFLLLRYPRFLVLFILAAANHVLIIGYELQVSVDRPTAVVSPQRYFPVYSLAPYRLLCVLSGLFAAFIFTLFPVQISEHKILRASVAESLILLANYSNSVSATLDQRIHGTKSNSDQFPIEDMALKAFRNGLLFKELALLARMRQISSMVPWEIGLGGKFPKALYDSLVDEIQSAVISLSLTAYISQTFPIYVQLPSNFFIRNVYTASILHPDSHEITTSLSLLALSLSSGSPLAPGLRAPSRRPQHSFLQKTIEWSCLDAVGDPNTEAFLVIDVANTQLLRSIARIFDTVTELVGTMNFGKEFYSANDDDTLMRIV